MHGAKLTLVERLQAIREVEKRSADELLSPRCAVRFAHCSQALSRQIASRMSS